MIAFLEVSLSVRGGLGQVERISGICCKLTEGYFYSRFYVWISGFEKLLLETIFEWDCGHVFD